MNWVLGAKWDRETKGHMCFQEKKKKANTTQFQLLHMWNSGEFFVSFCHFRNAGNETQEPSASQLRGQRSTRPGAKWGQLAEEKVYFHGFSRSSSDRPSVCGSLYSFYLTVHDHRPRLGPCPFWFAWSGMGSGICVLKVPQRNALWWLPLEWRAPDLGADVA